ncbi:hypothetical protein HAX54_005768 [Datura stramonium]|uniref:Uncharacterized protein n=1 Tax=Datura stramonium TaxID=4076 RepID=A0ABS8WY82_DATST|nr:hypothetical protein [Datura stramonium]
MMDEEKEHHAQITDMVKQVLEQIEVMRTQYMKQEKIIERMSFKLTEMKVEAETCNDLQVMVLANTQDEPQLEEKIEFVEQAQQIKFHEFLCDGLMYMANQFMEWRIELRQEIDQFSSNIHDLPALLNEKV